MLPEPVVFPDAVGVDDTVVGAAVCSAVGVAVAVGVDTVWDGWVQPAITRPARTQSPRIRTTGNLDSIYRTG
jgi:hypothetical protein